MQGANGEKVSAPVKVDNATVAIETEWQAPHLL